MGKRVNEESCELRVVNRCPGERVASQGGTRRAGRQEFVEALTVRQA